MEIMDGNSPSDLVGGQALSHRFFDVSVFAHATSVLIADVNSDNLHFTTREFNCYGWLVIVASINTYNSHIISFRDALTH